MKGPKRRVAARAALTATEAAAAAATPVWVVWWEDPERSWEAICLSAAESEMQFKAREADPLLKHWGKVGKSDQRSLLEWLESHLRVVPADCAEDFVNPAKEILRRVADGASGPVIVRTW